MEVIGSKHLDHHGVVAGVMIDLGLAHLIDEKLPKDSSAKISNGQAVLAMVLNSLGFTSRPLTLTPQFFASKALDVLFGTEVEADDFNRHRLGRCLDEIYEYGCDELFSELAQHVCRQESVSKQFVSLDTTSFNVTGNYERETDTHEITITHGFLKDHRPDLKQMVLELLVSQDGGVPLMSKSFDGNASDSRIFKSRCKALVQQFKESEGPNYLVADAKLYDKGNADNLSSLQFITRIPRTLKEEKKAVAKALSECHWEQLDEENKFHIIHCEHYGIKQRWLVIYSNAAHSRAEQTLNKWVKKETEKSRLLLKHLRNKSFACESDALDGMHTVGESLKYHCLTDIRITKKPCYRSKGRPKAGAMPSHFDYVVTAHLEADAEKQKQRIEEKSCYVIGTNIIEEELSAQEAIQAYKNQNAAIERGFRFLKDPYFFASSFFIKKSSRIMALLMVMTLSLLIYSIAQRKVRGVLRRSNQTLPNQINQATEKPTLRWIFQILEGISVVYIRVKNKIERTITGLDQLKAKIIGLFSENVQVIYGITKNTKSG